VSIRKWLRVKPAGKTKSEDKQLRDAVKMMMMVLYFIILGTT
jgi:hypothetical protein